MPDQLTQLPDLTDFSHGWRSLVAREHLIDATLIFNPTLAIDGGAVWMAYRRISPDEWLGGPRTIAMTKLGADLQPVPGSSVDLSARIVDPPGADRWHADPRFFTYQNQVWLSYHDNYRLYAVPLQPDQLAAEIHPLPVRLSDRSPRERERNWGFFDDGELKAVYTINPLVVLEMSRGERGLKAITVAETDASLPWDQERWGEPHGGSMPVRIGDHWFAFFQSASWDAATNHRHYRVGFYGFDAAPPYCLRMMSKEPVLDAGEFEGQKSFYQDWSVVYPSGALNFGDRWLVSLGIHDRSPALAVFDHQTLLDGCSIIR